MIYPTKAEITRHVMQFAEMVDEDFSHDLQKRLKFKVHVKMSSASACLGFAKYVPVSDEYSITLNIKEMTERNIVGYSEYSSYQYNSTIGSIRTNDWKIVVETIYLHELAHIIHFYHKRFLLPTGTVIGDMKQDSKPHGVAFKKIYAILRERYINDRIDIKDRGIKTTTFDINETLESYEEILRKSEPHMVGRAVNIRGMGFTITGKSTPRSRSYFATHDETGKLYKLSDRQVKMYSLSTYTK